MALALQPQHRINVRSGCAKKLSHVRRSASRPQRAGKTEAHGRRAALSIAGTLALAPPEAGAVKLPVQRQERKYSVRIPYGYFNEIDSTGLCVYDFKHGTGTMPEKGARVASHYDLKTSGIARFVRHLLHFSFHLIIHHPVPLQKQGSSSLSERAGKARV